jgi:RimJ/RimL family protein N-acetyltransferase
VERLEASTDVDNAAEQRALEGAGFTREGVLRSAQFRDGAFHDLVLYSRCAATDRHRCRSHLSGRARTTQGERA